MDINIERYIKSFNELFLCGGKTGEAGLTRVALSYEEKNARDLIVKWMKDSNLEVKIDDMGNIYGIRHGTDDLKKPLLIGSHIDTVYNGGKYDGIVGALAGLEIIRTLDDNNVTTKMPIIACVWTNEEGVRFRPPMMGSGVIVGKNSLESCYNSKAVEGDVTFEEELKRIGYKGKRSNRIGDIGAYLEIHIEQGPILEDKGLALGILPGIKGMIWNEITVVGEENHAGPIPMKRRKDALLASIHIMTEIEKIADDNQDSNTTVTFGKINVYPNVLSIIPGKVVFTQDLRSESQEVMEQGNLKVHQIIKDVESTYNVQISIKNIEQLNVTMFDERLKNMIKSAMDNRKYPYDYLYSGAGHDAFKIASKYPAAMIFIRTKGGKSHCPDEYADFSDIEQGLNVLLDTVINYGKG